MEASSWSGALATDGRRAGGWGEPCGQQVELGAGQPHRDPAHPHLVGGHIHDEISENPCRLRGASVVRGRRSTAATRATSSRTLNGLVM